MKKRNRAIFTLLLSILLIASVLSPAAFAYGGYSAPVEAAGGLYHTVVRYSDNTVAAVGDNSYGQCSVSSWRDIVQIAVGFHFTVGLRSDGTVVATGDNSYGQCNVSRWNNIVQIAAGEKHTLGLRSDGTVVAVGSNSDNQCNVSGWRNIRQIAAAKVNSVGVTANKQVIVRGAFTNLEDFYIGGWQNITSIAVGTGYFVGIHPDGTVVGYGKNTDPSGRGNYEELSVSGWSNLAQIAVNRGNVYGLEYYGTVRISGRNDFGQYNQVSRWTDITAIGTGVNHVIGIRSDGQLVAAGDNSHGQCNVSGLSRRTGGGSTSSGSQSGGYLNEMKYSSKYGKIWTRSTANVSYAHGPQDAPGCWSDTVTPGHSSGTVKDNAGNVYTYGLHVDGSDLGPYSISYDLGGRYSVLSGVVAYPGKVINSQWSPYYSKYVCIYGDGKLLYTSPTISSGSNPASFRVSVNGVYTLTIQYPATEGPNEVATLFDVMVR